MPYGHILGTKQTVHTLVQLHSELGGKLNANRKEAERIAADMRHVKAVIQMLEPGFDVTGIAARRRYRTNQHFKRGTIFNRALDVLRVAVVNVILPPVTKRPDQPLTVVINFSMISFKELGKYSVQIFLDDKQYDDNISLVRAPFPINAPT